MGFAVLMMFRISRASAGWRRGRHPSVSPADYFVVNVYMHSAPKKGTTPVPCTSSVRQNSLTEEALPLSQELTPSEDLNFVHGEQERTRVRPDKRLTNDR